MYDLPAFLKEQFSEQLAGIAQLQTQLGYQFHNISLLVEALTHSSIARPTQLRDPEAMIRWNERLEFLGDAVLGLCISSILTRRPEGFAEGELSRIRSSFVNERSLSEIGRFLGIGDLLIMSLGEEKNGGRMKNSLIADGLEAVIGAIYLDGGYGQALQTVNHVFAKHLAQDPHMFLNEDHKTKLQELSQKLSKQTPTYRIADENGPDHLVTFTVEVLFDDIILGTGVGNSKKVASQAAANAALKRQDLLSLLTPCNSFFGDLNA